MKRWTFRIVLCLLLGEVTTVGVAVVVAALRGAFDQDLPPIPQY